MKAGCGKCKCAICLWKISFQTGISCLLYCTLSLLCEANIYRHQHQLFMIKKACLSIFLSATSKTLKQKKCISFLAFFAHVRNNLSQMFFKSHLLSHNDAVLNFWWIYFFFSTYFSILLLSIFWSNCNKQGSYYFLYNNFILLIYRELCNTHTSIGYYSNTLYVIG